MTGATDERVLATWLARLTDEALADLFERRGVSRDAGWRDFFDAAEALLDPASIDRALLRVPRATLATLAVAAGTPVAEPERTSFAAHALTRPDGTSYRTVAARVQAHGAEQPGAFAPVLSQPEPRPADPAHEAVAAERTSASIASLGDVLFHALHAPLRRTAGGLVSAADRKGLVEDGVVSSGEQLDDLLRVADAAGLIRSGERQWLVTRSGQDWLHDSPAARWERIAAGILATIPEPLRTPDGGYSSAAEWSDAFPLDAGWPASAAFLHRAARAWGLLTDDGAETQWGSTVRTQGRPDAASLAAHLPPEIEGVFLQADLSAIAPGPLRSALDLRLRGIAVRESRAQASIYRFTPESVAVGLADGETAESVLSFLGDLSLTGIPQPLQYLVETTAARHGLVRVSGSADGARVRSSDEALLATLEVDQTLRVLGFVRDSYGLRSRVSRDGVYWALADAKYPVVAVDAAGTPEPVRRSRLAQVVDTGDTGYVELIARLRDAEGADTEAAWRERELDQAVRERAEIVVVVRLPDGGSRELTLEATGLGGGRLRGRDRAADLERTLPVSSIVSIRLARYG